MAKKSFDTGFLARLQGGPDPGKAIQSNIAAIGRRQQSYKSRLTSIIGTGDVNTDIGSPATIRPIGSGPTNASVGKKSQPNKGFSAFVNSIAKQESGGNYGAVNKSSGALGKYQIMPANIASWSKAALGHSVTTQQFLNSPKLQDQIAQSKLRYYYNKYGAAGAAKAWYGGEGAARSTSTRKQGAYPSIAAYAAKVTGRLK
jgi:hypothetical protein